MKTAVNFVSSPIWQRAGIVPKFRVTSRNRFVLLRPSAQKDNKSISFGDKLLDYIEGGPKLRKWYGAADEGESDSAESDAEEQTTGEEDRDAVLVTDGDCETGQLVVLALIVKRNRVRVLVSDKKLATAAFGSYVEPVVGNVDDRASLERACKGVRSIICPAKLGALADKKILKGVQKIVFLSEVTSLKSARGLKSLFNRGAIEQALRDERALSEVGVSYTIVRPALLIDEPGGRMGIEVKTAVGESESSSQSGVERSISREDVANFCVEALGADYEQSAILEVTNS